MLVYSIGECTKGLTTLVLFCLFLLFLWLLQVKIDEVALEKAAGELPAGVTLRIAWVNSSFLLKTLSVTILLKFRIM